MRKSIRFKLKDQPIKKGSVLSITLLILSGELIYLLPYVLPRIFRPTFLEVFNLNNLQLGSLFSVYGIIALLSYVYGGVISDKFQPKKLMSYSLFFTSFGGLVLASYPSYFVLQILYGYWGFTTVFLFWGAMIKATRVWGGTDNQGQAFGFLDGGRGLVAASMGSLGILIFSRVGTHEFGFKYNTSKFDFSAAIFSRRSKNIIDYVKKNQNDLWKAVNIGSLNTKGFEFDLIYNFSSNSLSLGYSNIKDDNYVSNINYSKYSLNSIKNHFISKLNLNYKNVFHSIVYKYAERSNGVSYSVLDSKVSYKSFFVSVNNILDEVYSETNLVPMPGRNMLLGVIFSID